MRAVNVEKLVFNIFVGERGDRLVVVHLPAPTEATSVAQA